MKIIIVILAYNEGPHISKVINGISEYNLPIIVVDDGSTDNTAREVKKSSGVILLKHSINLGKGAAMKTGAIAAFKSGAEAVVFMDADGQHSPDDLYKFLTKLSGKKYDIVFGVRKLDKKSPLIRSWGNRLGSFIVNILFDIEIPDLLCGFRGITEEGYKLINWESTGYGVETEMVVKTAKSQLNYCTVPVKTIYHDKVKGVTIIDALSLFFNVVRWKVNI